MSSSPSNAIREIVSTVSSIVMLVAVYKVWGGKGLKVVLSVYAGSLLILFSLMSAVVGGDVAKSR
jgi:hypothetical protein